MNLYWTHAPHQRHPAFDTLDHDILLQHLKVSFCFTDVALQWRQSYLVGRLQYVWLGDRCQVNHRRAYVWSAKVLGPILLVVYTAVCRRCRQLSACSLSLSCDIMHGVQRNINSSFVSYRMDDNTSFRVHCSTLSVNLVELVRSARDLGI